jgi:hypothetical protein
MTVHEHLQQLKLMTQRHVAQSIALHAHSEQLCTTAVQIVKERHELHMSSARMGLWPAGGRERPDSA